MPYKKKKEEQYIDLIPDEQMVEKLKYYKENGAKIVLFSSRNMNSYHGNLGLINANTAVIMQEWLKNGIFHMMKFYLENHGQDIKDYILTIELSDQMNF